MLLEGMDDPTEAEIESLCILITTVRCLSVHLFIGIGPCHCMCICHLPSLRVCMSLSLTLGRE